MNERIILELGSSKHEALTEILVRKNESQTKKSQVPLVPVHSLLLFVQNVESQTRVTSPGLN
jgi:hypothetical protein